MAFTKITHAGIGSTGTVLLENLEVTGVGTFGGSVSVGGTLTYEDVTNIDSVGLITARAGVVVGSGITLSKDGDIFATGITTVSGNVKVGTGITLSPDGDVFATGVTTSTTFSGAFSGSGANITALNASNISSGTVPTARLGSGTASSSTFLRGDSTFAAVTSTTINNNANNSVITGSGTANTLEAEANLTFTGSILTVTNNSGASELTLVTPNNTDGGVYFNDGSNSGAVTYQHSDDSMRFRVNSLEKLRITSDGDLGVGMDSPWARLVVHETSSNTSLTGHNYLASISGMSIENGSTTDGCFSAYSARVKNAGGTQQSGSIAFKSTSGGYAPEIHLTQRNGSGSQRSGLMIDSGGKLIMGGGGTTNDTSERFLVDGSASGDHCGMGIKTNNNVHDGYIAFHDTDATYRGKLVYDHEVDDMYFHVNGSEKMRIDSAGRVDIGGNSGLGSKFVVRDTSFDAFGVYCASESHGTIATLKGGTSGSPAGTLTYISFQRNDGNTRGSITNSGATQLSFNNSSDYRLKENAISISDGITRLKTLKPYRFNFKDEPDRTIDGFFAHEVTAVPEAITGTKDEVDSDNNPVYQGIDQSKLVPLLTAALQEEIAKREALEVRIAALEG